MLTESCLDNKSENWSYKRPCKVDSTSELAGAKGGGAIPSANEAALGSKVAGTLRGGLATGIGRSRPWSTTQGCTAVARAPPGGCCGDTGDDGAVPGSPADGAVPRGGALANGDEAAAVGAGDTGVDILATTVSGAMGAAAGMTSLPKPLGAHCANASRAETRTSNAWKHSVIKLTAFTALRT